HHFGLKLKSCLTTFNWGAGYYLIVPPRYAESVCQIGGMLGYDMAYVGDTRKGPRQVVFKPGNITLHPE
ncbi:MAG TPA: hypothetical protein VL306_02990, partial [Methylomirabilota bacterium]|nr:hypothetical protein [Methylomirabilota bacterium]